MNANSIALWLQTLTAIFGFVALCWYCWETHKIRVATLSQAEASQRPFFSFELQEVKALQLFRLIAKNVGLGHALDLKVFWGDGDRLQETAKGNAISINQEVEILSGPYNDTHLNFKFKNGVRLEYSDLAGKKYFSQVIVAIGHDGRPIADHFTLETGTVSADRAMRWR